MNATIYLQCDSHGDRRFSAFYARLANNCTIEECYQRAKRDENEKPFASLKDAKGKNPTFLYFNKKLHICTSELRHNFYLMLWYIYFQEHEDLRSHALTFSRFKDSFAEEGKIISSTDVDLFAPRDSGCNQARAIAQLVRLYDDLFQGWNPNNLTDEFKPEVYEALEAYRQSTHATWHNL